MPPKPASSKCRPAKVIAKRQPAPVWLVIIKVFLVFDKIFSLPVRYDEETETFSVNKNCFTKWYRIHMASYRFGSLCVYSFFFRIIYKLLVQLLAPERNKHLPFGMAGVLLHLIGFLICLEAVICFYTVEFCAVSLVNVMNLLMEISKSQKTPIRSRLSVFGRFHIDTGEAVAVTATLGFMAFPGIAGLAHFVMENDPASHILIELMPHTEYIWARRLLAGGVQGTVAAFGAIVCLHVLFMFIVVIMDFAELISIAVLHTNKRKKKGFELVKACIGESKKNAPATLIKVAKQVYIRNEADGRLFRPSFMVHRQLTILEQISKDGLLLYSAGIVAVGVCLVILTVFFSIRFTLPLPVAIPNTIIAVSVSCIMVGLIPEGEKLQTVSRGFHQFWRERLTSRLARLMLLSCKPSITIPIGGFTHFKKGLMLSIFHVIITQLSTLLINFQ